MKTHKMLGVVAAISVAVLLGAGPSGAQEGPTPMATVTVVHGLRGQLVDVYLDDVLTLKGFQPERVTDALPVPAGEHRLSLRPAGSPAQSNPMATDSVMVEAGSNLSVVAHFDSNGKPTVTAFKNDTNPLAAGKARLVARSTAQVSAITLVVNDQPVAPVAPEAQYAADLDPAIYKVAVDGPAGGTIVPATDVPVVEGASTIMYLIGSQRNNDLIWIGQSIGGLQAPPTAVATGNSGLAAPNAVRRDRAPERAGAVALSLALVGGFLVRRGRRTA